jgi:hypothetical protein
MKLLPFRQINDNDIVNQFALEGTGEAGLLVTVSNGNMDAQTDWNYTNFPSVSVTRVSNYKMNTKTTVRQSQSGDTKFGVLGVTLFNVAVYNENGEKYEYLSKERRAEQNVIVSGNTMPVLTKGLLTLGSGAYNGTPAVGSVLIASDTVTGAFDVKAYSAVSNKDQILGKVIGTGARHGGYVMALINCGV